MSILTIYILRQMLIPLVIITLTLSGIIWMLRALRLLDTIIISGQDISTWAELLFYTMPTVLILVLPPAFLFAVFYSFYRLFMDSEIMVMFSGGVSRARLLRPVLLLGGFTTMIVLALGTYAAPWSNRQLKTLSLEISGDIANTMLRPGMFTNPADGIIAFIRTRDEEGFLRGIFFQDSRNRNNPVSYTAESGALIRNGQRTELIMFNGHVQHHNRHAKNSGLTLIQFDRYSYDLSQLANVRPSKKTRAEDLYPHEIYARWMNPERSTQQRKDIIVYTNRLLLRTLYPIIYALLVLAIFLPAQINREGYMKRIIIAMSAALAMRLGSFSAASAAAESILFVIAAHAIPLATGGVALFIILRGVGPIVRIRHHWANKRAARQMALEKP